MPQWPNLCLLRKESLSIWTKPKARRCEWRIHLRNVPIQHYIISYSSIEQCFMTTGIVKVDFEVFRSRGKAVNEEMYRCIDVSHWCSHFQWLLWGYASCGCHSNPILCSIMPFSPDITVSFPISHYLSNSLGFWTIVTLECSSLYLTRNLAGGSRDGFATHNLLSQC